MVRQTRTGVAVGRHDWFRPVVAGHNQFVKRLTSALGILLVATPAVVAVVRGNIIGAVAFGAMTLLLVWWAVRPKPAGPRKLHPLRGTIGAAAVSSVIVTVVILTTVFTEDQRGRALSVVAGVVGVPFTGFLWWLVCRAWRDGFRWSTSATVEELRSRRDNPPSSRSGPP